MSSRVGASRRATLATSALLVAVLAGHAGASATIQILDVNEPGDGYDDPTPVAPVGGNPEATLGAQRLFAARHAADLWATALDSSVPIDVDTVFVPLACDATGAVLGSAGPTTLHRNFAGAPLAAWYAQALANKLAGVDLDPETSDIVMVFNSALDAGCALGRPWYYGVDASPPSGHIDFVTVVLHELAHGLGFLSAVSLSTGAKLLGHDDAYSVHLEDHETGLLYPNMTDAERENASRNRGDLHWTGQLVVGASSSLTGGVGPGGHVEMYAPSPIQPGSSVSHFSNELSPDQLMEPAFTAANHDLGLALPLLLDAGWGGEILPCGDGMLDAGEECDDGGNSFGDCCSAFCSHEAASSPCSPSGICAASAACDGAGMCLDGAEPKGCDDHRWCTDDACDPSIGCTHTLNGKKCEREFVVNAVTAGVERTPAAAVAHDGGFLVVWQHHDLSAPHVSDVYARRFDANGVAYRDDVLVNTYTTGTQRAPDVCTDADGNFVVVWQGQGDGDYRGIFGRRLAADATPIGDEFRLNVVTEGLQSQGLSVACGPDGGFTAAWDSEPLDPSQGTDVVLRRFDAEAQPLGTELVINTYTTGRQWFPKVAYAPSGELVALWASGCPEGFLFPGCDASGASQDGSLAAVIGRRVDADGAPIGGEFQVNTRTAGEQGILGLDVSVDASGEFVVVWTGSRTGQPCGGFVPCTEAFAQRFDAAGQRVGTEFQVNVHTKGQQVRPSVAHEPDGGFIVAWQGEGLELVDGPRCPSFGPCAPERSISARRFASDATPLSGEFQVNTYTVGAQDYPWLSRLGDGQLVVVWQSSNERNPDNVLDLCGLSADGCEDAVMAKVLDAAAPECPISPSDAVCPVAESSSLTIRYGAADKLSWKWRKGSVLPGAFSPMEGLSGHALCVYESSLGTPTNVLRLALAGDATCEVPPCWKTSKRSARFKFADPSGTNDGLLRLNARSRGSRRGSISLKAGGSDLSLPDLGAAQGPVTVLLLSGSGGCWSGYYPQITNQGETIRAKH